MKTHRCSSGEELMEVRARCLVLETAEPFRSSGDQLRRCITAMIPDDRVLHHHVEGSRRLDAPSVRYVVIRGIPQLIGVGDGLPALEKVYALPDIRLTGRCGPQPVEARELWDVHARIGAGTAFATYTTLTPWLALNQRNHRRYQEARNRAARNAILEEIFIGNVLAMLGSFGCRVETRLEARILRCREVTVQHKRTPMLGFRATLETNAVLHPWLGIGKLVSKGYGLFVPEEKLGVARGGGFPMSG